MLVMRIGGDEFALLTGEEDLQKAEVLMKKVLAGNGQPFLWSGKEIPLSLRAGVTIIPEQHLRYSELFTQMHDAIQLSRKVQTM